MPNIVLGTSRARMNELIGQRADLLKNAEAQLTAGNRSEYDSLMAKVKALNPQIDDLKAVVDEYDRYDIAHAPKFGAEADTRDLSEMGKMLAAGERVGFTTDSVKRALVQNSVLFSGNIVAPTGGGSEVHDGTATQVSSLIDQVRVETFDGLNAWEEAYVKTMATAYSGKPETVAGSARTESSPSFRISKMLAHEVNTTSYTDRNIQRLSPARYAAKIQELALKSMRAKINHMIVNGDALAQHEFFGFLNAKNTVAENIFVTSSDVTTIDKDTLKNMVFGFGGSEEVSAQARMVLSKNSLNAFAGIPVSATDNRDLYDISQDGNTGFIKKGALTVPYTICSAVGDSAISYVDLMSYMLCLFGPYTIRVDESVKSIERMIAILGDGLVGGNMIADKAALNATLSE